MRVVMAWLACAALCSAQIGTSTITGRVTDPTGAVVPNVVVTVIQTETNYQFTAMTNSDGLFRVQSLQPGTYRVTFEAQGFKRFVRDAVDLRTGDVLAIDAALQLGSVAEQVEVTGAAPLLETETSAAGALMEGSVLYRLPLYQRYINSTLNLVPGMTSGGYAYGGDLGAYHLAGQRSGSIGVFEDGVNGNDQGSGTGTIKPLQNAVAEVKVLTTTLPAEYGHSAGGVISVVKKSGTNELHGMASMFGRSRRMQHRLFFDRFRTSDKTATSPNGVDTFFLQPDFNLGGPVRIPKLYDGRNKTFFFAGYQRLIEKKIAQVVTTVPTPEMKSGDFSFGGIGLPIFDPASTRMEPGRGWVRDPIPGNRIPQDRIDPVARKVLEFDPWFAPNQAGTVNNLGPRDNYLADEYARVYFDDLSVRLDHQFNPAVKIYGSWTNNHQSDYGRPWNVRLADFDGQAGRTIPFRQQNYSAGKTWVINPTMFNDARVGYFRRRQFRLEPDFNKDYGRILGIPNIAPTFMPSFSSCANPTSCSDSERSDPRSIYGLTGGSQFRQVFETLSFRDDLTKVAGAHAFKVGYELLRFRLNRSELTRPSGAFFFDGMTAGLQADGLGAAAPNTGNTFAGFLLGYVRQATFDLELAAWHPRSSIHSFYVQDDWKVSPTLTANLGLRYTNESPFDTRYGLMSNLDPTARDDVRPGAPGAIVHPASPLNRRDNNNFQPRVGLAWHPFQKWVFRGGFSVHTIDVKYPQTRGQFEEYVAINNQQQAPGDPRPLYRISQGPNPVTYNIRPNGTAGFVGANFGSRASEWWDPNLRNPYVLNWHASTQYEFTRNYLLEISYQASSGVGLLERWQVNTFPIDFAAGDPALRSRVFAAAQNYRPFAHFGDVRMRSNFGHSTFHSGTVKIERRFSEGLFFSTFYTFSKAIDSQDGDNDGSGVAPIQNRGLEKARAGFDRNHRFIGTVTYELPLGRGKKFLNRGGWWHHIFGGYDIAWIQTIESGNPLTFGFDGSPFNYYPGFAGSRRPDLVSRPVLRDNWGDLGGDRFRKENINPIVDINHFAYPAAFTPGNAGRNITTGTRLLWSQVSAAKTIDIGERWNFQIRWDFQNALKTYNFNAPDTTVNFQRPREFGKLTSDPRTASLGGQPLMNLTLQLRW
jgi:hypothetical protein